jgi:hypothetical protein
MTLRVRLSRALAIVPLFLASPVPSAPAFSQSHCANKAPFRWSHTEAALTATTKRSFAIMATETNTTTDAVVTPIRPLGAKPGPKDPTGAARQRRFKQKRKQQRSVRPATVTRDVLPIVTHPLPDAVSPTIAEHRLPCGTVTRLSTGVDVAAYMAAVALASAAAWFSIRGMVVLFPGSPTSVVAMTVAMEAAKLVTAGWLASRWSMTAWFWRITLVAFIIGLAVINATGVFAQLVAALVGERGAAQSDLETKDAALAARIDVQSHTVVDLDRRLGQIDVAIEEAAKRGRTNAVLSAIEGQRKARSSLVDERKREAGTLADLQAERASVAATGRRIETEAAPVRYVADLVGTNTDSGRAIRWLIALMVLCCDPLAIALTAAASAQG